MRDTKDRDRIGCVPRCLVALASRIQERRTGAKPTVMDEILKIHERPVKSIFHLGYGASSSGRNLCPS